MINHAIIIIPAASKDECNALARSMFGGEGDNFTIGLNASGLESDPPTHFWCAPRMTSERVSVIQEVLPEGSIFRTYDSNVQFSFPFDLLTELGLKVITKPTVL